MNRTHGIIERLKQADHFLSTLNRCSENVKERSRLSAKRGELGLPSTSFPYIPYKSSPSETAAQIFSVLGGLKKPFDRIRICDAGIGYGDFIIQVCAYLSEFGFQTMLTGLDLCEVYIQALQNNRKNLPSFLKHKAILTKGKQKKYFHPRKADILEYKNYSQFDVIYCYRPLSNSSVLQRFYKTVAEQMSQGAVFIDVGGVCYDDRIAAFPKHKFQERVFRDSFYGNVAHTFYIKK